MKIMTSIPPKVLKEQLFRGSLLSFIGLCSIFGAYFSLNEKELACYGWILFLAGMSAIAYGMIPFRKLTRLQIFPYYLQITTTHLIYFKGEKPLLEIPKIDLLKITYRQEGDKNGIGVSLRKRDKIHIYDYKESKTVFRKASNVDLFFPYFSRTSFDQLLNYLPENK